MYTYLKHLLLSTLQPLYLYIYIYVCLCIYIGGPCHHLKNGKEASEDIEESPAGCAGEGKQSKGN